MIDPRAVVDPGAEIAEDVEIGPFAVIGAGVSIGAGSWIGPHAVVKGPTILGRNTRVFQFASIGDAPQDRKYAGEPTRLVVGDRNVFREFCSINRGTVGGRGETTIADDCLFMAYSHVAHDCIVGSNVIFSHGAMAAGHCQISDFAIISGGAAVIQFARIGAHAFVGGMSGLENDLIPYGMALGNRAYLSGLNIVGLQRRGFPRDQIHDLRRAYRLLFAAEGTLLERAEDVASAFRDHAIVTEILEFIKAGGKRSLCTPRQSGDE